MDKEVTKVNDLLESVEKQYGKDSKEYEFIISKYSEKDGSVDPNRSVIIKEEEIDKSFKYIPKTDEEIKQIALDIYNSKIFTSYSVPENMLKSVFMPLFFMSQPMLKSLVYYEISTMYEYLSKASERSVNGFPCFFSVNYLNEEDTKKVTEKLIKIEEAMKDV